MGINSVLLYAMMLTIAYGVVMRYIFNAPVRQIPELSAHMLVALTFVVLAYIQRQRQHVRVSFFVVRQGAKTQAIVGITATACALLAFVLLTWATWGFALEAWRLNFIAQEAGYPLFFPRLLVPIGSFVMCLQLLADLGSGISSLFRIGKLHTPREAGAETGHGH